MEETSRNEMAQALKSRSKLAFDAQAPTYDAGWEGAHARSLYPLVAAEVASAMERTDRPLALDAGCGTGALAQAIAERAPDCRVRGVDLSPRMVDVARARFVGAGLADRAVATVGDVERLPFSDSTFDVAWCNDSFHHWPDPDRAAFEVWRVLKRGGVFVLGDVWQPALARAIMNAWLPFSREGDVRIYSESELRGILGAWFDEVEWRRVGFRACVAVARKG